MGALDRTSMNAFSMVHKNWHRLAVARGFAKAESLESNHSATTHTSLSSASQPLARDIPKPSSHSSLAVTVTTPAASRRALADSTVATSFPDSQPTTEVSTAKTQPKRNQESIMR